MTWRKRARRYIRQTIADNPGLAWIQMLLKVDAAYPFGPRSNHPYKVWLEERSKAMSEYAAMIGDADPLHRVCPACAAPLCRACVDLEDGEPSEFHAARRGLAEPRASVAEVSLGPLFDDRE